MRWLVFILLSVFTLAASGKTLGQKQREFSPLVAKLILHAEKLGYQVTLGEAWRSPEMAMLTVPTAQLEDQVHRLCPMCQVTAFTKWYADRGIGIANSLHTKRLAIDINLFRAGKYLTDTEDYRPLGEWWEKQCSECRWGGRFVKLPDGNHFSMEHEGAK